MDEADIGEHFMAGEAARGLAGQRTARVVRAVRIAALARANVYRERKRSLSAS
jgi:hypothetical protein